MNTQRKIEKTDTVGTRMPAPPVAWQEAPLGGQIRVWHDQIGAAFVDRPLAPDAFPHSAADAMISSISRWSGPAIFVAVIAGLLYSV